MALLLSNDMKKGLKMLILNFNSPEITPNMLNKVLTSKIKFPEKSSVRFIYTPSRVGFVVCRESGRI